MKGRVLEVPYLRGGDGHVAPLKLEPHFLHLFTQLLAAPGGAWAMDTDTGSDRIGQDWIGLEGDLC